MALIENTEKYNVPCIFLGSVFLFSLFFVMSWTASMEVKLAEPLPAAHNFFVGQIQGESKAPVVRAMTVNIEPKTLYFIKTEVSGEPEIHIDLMSTAGGYDNSQQEGIISAGTKSGTYSFLINSGNAPPKDVLFRIFFKDDHSIVVKSIDLLQVPAWIPWISIFLFWPMLVTGLLFIFFGLRLIQKTDGSLCVLKTKFANLVNTWIPFSWKTWLIIVLASVIVIGHTGFWMMPNIGAQFMVSQNLTSNPFPNPHDQYIFTSYFQPLIFGIFGGTSSLSYVIYASMITICFLFLFLLWFIKFHGRKIAVDEHKILLTILFPVFMVPFYWIGMDGMTLLLMLMIMINFSSKWAIIPAILLAWQHFEQGSVAVMILLGTLIISMIITHDKSKFVAMKRLGYIIGGLILGKVLILLLFSFLHISMSADRLTNMISDVSIYIDQWKVSWPYILYSIFGVGWLLIFTKLKKTWPLLVGGIFTFFFVIIMGDQTRVGAIVLFPAVFFWIFMDKELFSTINQKMIVCLVVLYLVLPVVFVWGGFPYKNLWTYDITTERAIQESSGTNIYQFDPMLPFKRD
jgi:hypothetical protein